MSPSSFHSLPYYFGLWQVVIAINKCEYIGCSQKCNKNSEQNPNKVGDYLHANSMFFIAFLGGDIDTLCVGPKHVTREDFFQSFIEVLQAHPDVRDLCVRRNNVIVVVELFL